MVIEEYNKKDFLLPDSIESAAMYHAKLFAEGPNRGEYIFRIHDCITGIRLRGELRTENDFDDAFHKFEKLAEAVFGFAVHIDKLKQLNFKNHEQTKSIHR